MSLNGDHPNRTAHQILLAALQELEEREEKLSAFIEEHKEVVHAISVIEKAMQNAKKRVSTKSGKAVHGESPRRKFKRRISDLLATQLDPLEPQSVANALGSNNVKWVTQILREMEGAGEVAKIEGGYGKPIHSVA